MRAILVGAAAVAASLALAGSREVAGENAGRRVDPAALEFAVGNVEFLLVHEIAHFLLEEKEVPIIGPEETAADYIATLALIREEPLDPAEQDRASRFLLAAADAFFRAWQAGEKSGAVTPYWESHGLSIQRYYQIACLLYGSDPVAFARVREIAGLPDERARGCMAEYASAERGIQWLLATYGRRDGDAASAVTPIVYDEPPSQVSARVLQEVRRLQLPELIIERLHERFTIERPFTLAMRSCGMAEAAWLPAQRELVLCYELLDTLYLLGLTKHATGLRSVAPAN